MGFLPESAGKDRARLMLAGGAFIIFGFYVASQDSGTYYFPAGIFMLPFAIALYAGFKAFERRQRSAPVPPAGGKAEQ